MEAQKRRRKVTPGGFLVSDAFFVVMSIALNYFVIHANVVDLFTKPWGIGEQLLFGIAVGAVTSILLVLYITRTRMLDTEITASNFAQLAAYPYWLLLTAGFTAGFAEEFLMRGTIQVIAGIWIASLLFMFAHAPYWGTRPFTVGKGIFAFLAFLAGVGTGYTFIVIGLTAVFIIHSAVDMSLFATIRKHFLGQHRVARGQATA